MSRRNSRRHRRNLLRPAKGFHPLTHLRRAGGQHPSPYPPLGTKTQGGLMFHDTQTGMPFGIPKGARCVQRFDDSLNSAIHITYRISLRSSSMREPRDPLLKVLLYLYYIRSLHHVWRLMTRGPTSSQRYEGLIL